MKSETSIKLAIVAVIAILFSGLVLRAALRLAVTVAHSALAIIILVVLIAWFSVKSR